MPDTIITQELESRVTSATIVPFKTLIRSQRSAFKNWEKALRLIDVPGDEVPDPALVAASDAAQAAYDEATRKVIDAPTGNMDDIAVKLRFYFEVEQKEGGMIDMRATGSRLLKRLVSDIERRYTAFPASFLKRACKEAFRASSDATSAADEKAFGVKALHPPCPERVLVESEGGDGKFRQRPGTAEDFVWLQRRGELTEADAKKRLDERQEWLAACATIDAAHGVDVLRKAAEEADDRWQELDRQFVAAPVQTVEDIRVKLEFLPRWTCQTMLTLHTRISSSLA